MNIIKKYKLIITPCRFYMIKERLKCKCLTAKDMIDCRWFNNKGSVMCNRPKLKEIREINIFNTKYIFDNDVDEKFNKNE